MYTPSASNDTLLQDIKSNLKSIIDKKFYSTPTLRVAIEYLLWLDSDLSQLDDSTLHNKLLDWEEKLKNELHQELIKSIMLTLDHSVKKLCMSRRFLRFQKKFQGSLQVEEHLKKCAIYTHKVEKDVILDEKFILEQLESLKNYLRSEDQPFFSNYQTWIAHDFKKQENAKANTKELKNWRYGLLLNLGKQVADSHFSSWERVKFFFMLYRFQPIFQTDKSILVKD
jgi:hypothetical protein